MQGCRVDITCVTDALFDVDISGALPDAELPLLIALSEQRAVEEAFLQAQLDIQEEREMESCTRVASLLQCVFDIETGDVQGGMSIIEKMEESSTMELCRKEHDIVERHVAALKHVNANEADRLSIVQRVNRLAREMIRSMELEMLSDEAVSHSDPAVVLVQMQDAPHQLARRTARDGDQVSVMPALWECTNSSCGSSQSEWTPHEQWGVGSTEMPNQGLRDDTFDTEFEKMKSDYDGWCEERTVTTSAGRAKAEVASRLQGSDHAMTVPQVILSNPTPPVTTNLLPGSFEVSDTASAVNQHQQTPNATDVAWGSGIDVDKVEPDRISLPVPRALSGRLGTSCKEVLEGDVVPHVTCEDAFDSLFFRTRSEMSVPLETTVTTAGPSREHSGETRDSNFFGCGLDGVDVDSDRNTSHGSGDAAESPVDLLERVSLVSAESPVTQRFIAAHSSDEIWSEELAPVSKESLAGDTHLQWTHREVDDARPLSMYLHADDVQCIDNSDRVYKILRSRGSGECAEGADPRVIEIDLDEVWEEGVPVAPVPSTDIPPCAKYGSLGGAFTRGTEQLKEVGDRAKAVWGWANSVVQSLQRCDADPSCEGYQLDCRTYEGGSHPFLERLELHISDHDHGGSYFFEDAAHNVSDEEEFEEATL